MALGDAILANLNEIGSGFLDMDPTLATSNAAEASIRNRITFSNLRFTFPTTQGEESGFPKSANSGLSFPAYLTDFSDNFNISWKAETVFGRADQIPNYSNTTRTISLGFAIPCFDTDDANENIKKLNTFIRNLYPTYQELKGVNEDSSIPQRIMVAGPLMRVKFANLIVNHNNPSRGLLGYINGSVGIKHNFSDSGVFMESGLLTPGVLFPRVLEFSFTLTVLHEDTLGWNADDKVRKWFNNPDFPYRTKASFGDVISVIGGKIGLGPEIEARQILGWEG